MAFRHDGPPLRFDMYHRATEAAFDYLTERPDVDGDRIGVRGQSTGGQLAIRAAVHDPRLRAVVDVGGGYDFRRELTSLTPADVREEARDLHGFHSFADAVAYVRSAGSLMGLLGGLAVPLLIVHGGRDDLVADEEVELIAAEAAGPVEIARFPDGNHGVCNFNTEMTADMADWLAAALGGSRAKTRPMAMGDGERRRSASAKH